MAALHEKRSNIHKPEKSYLFDEDNDVLVVPYKYEKRSNRRHIPIRLLMSYTFRRLPTHKRVAILERLLEIENEKYDRERAEMPPLFDENGNINPAALIENENSDE